MGRSHAARLPQPASSRTAPVLPVRDNVHFPNLITTLLVGRDMSVKALRSAMKRDRHVLVVGQRDLNVEEPRSDDLYRTGTLSEVMQVLPMPDGTMRIVLRGVVRARIDQLAFRGGYYVAHVTSLLETTAAGPTLEAMRREAVEVFLEIVALGKQIPPEALEMLPAVTDPGRLADLIANHLNLQPSVKQALLEDLSAASRLHQLLAILVSERQVLELQSDIRRKVEEELGATQREYFLREQLRAIQQELSGPDEFSEEGREIHERILASGMPEETRERAIGELRRLERTVGSSPEGMVIRTYLDWLIALPWAALSDDRLDVKDAAKILDRGHFGLTGATSGSARSKTGFSTSSRCASSVPDSAVRSCASWGPRASARRASAARSRRRSVASLCG